MGVGPMTACYIDGDAVYLRPLEKEDYEVHYKAWTNDREVTRYLFRGTYPTTTEQLRDAYQATLASATDVELCVVAKETGDPIGIAGLHGLHWVVRSAEFRIMIGAKEYWNRGVGTEVVQLVTAYGFEILNLNKVWLGVSSGNQAAKQSYEKAGFMQEGVLREDVYRNGRYYDVIRMSLLHREYGKVVETWPVYPQIARQFLDSG